ncbi:MAG: primosomal replication protein N [Zoogloeaceae bacterium]|nr:primosomal replication protein N [Zoogloeaceae bacterium]
MRAQGTNQVLIDGTLAEKRPLRHTPAGIAVAEARLAHGSEQMEAGTPREAHCEIALLAIGDPATWLAAAPVGSLLRIRGFLSARSRNSKTPVLHVQTIEFLEGS